MTATFMGLKIIEHPLIPKRASYYRLAPGDYIGAEFRAQMQAWCDEFFGTYAPVFLVSGDIRAMHPENVALLRLRCENDSTPHQMRDPK